MEAAVPAAITDAASSQNQALRSGMISNGHAVKSEARLSSSYPHRGKRFKDGGRMALKIGDASWAYALIEEIRLVPGFGEVIVDLLPFGGYGPPLLRPERPVLREG